jgi:RNA polymerase sigma-70 factor (ECF subfamily)
MTTTTTKSTTSTTTPDSTIAVEKSILTQLAAGNNKAMDYMFDNYYNALCNHANRVVKDDTAAEDIVQEVMLTIWKKREQITIVSSLKAYLYRCVTNRSLNYLRDKKNHVEEIEDKFTDVSADIEEKIYFNETHQIIMEQVNKLSPRCRQVFIMNRLEQMKYKEIAAELEISVKTVEHHIAKGLMILRDSLSGLRLAA